MHRRQLEILQPCASNWTQMRGTNAVRHCESCGKNVYDLSMLTEREAKAALAVRPAEVCLRYGVDEAGHIRFFPETPSLRRSIAREALAAALTASLVTSSSFVVVHAQEAAPTLTAQEAEASARPEAAQDRKAHQRRARREAASEEAKPNAEAKSSDSCEPRWKQLFDEAGERSANYDAYERPMGGLPSAPRTRSVPPSSGALPAVPSRAQLLAAFEAVKLKLRATKCSSTGVAVVAIRIEGSSGMATVLNVTGVDAAGAACVGNTIRSTPFPRFQQQHFDVRVPFKLRL